MPFIMDVTKKDHKQRISICKHLAIMVGGHVLSLPAFIVVLVLYIWHLRCLLQTDAHVIEQQCQRPLQWHYHRNITFWISALRPFTQSPVLFMHSVQHIKQVPQAEKYSADLQAYFSMPIVSIKTAHSL